MLSNHRRVVGFDSSQLELSGARKSGRTVWGGGGGSSSFFFLGGGGGWDGKVFGRTAREAGQTVRIINIHDGEKSEWGSGEVLTEGGDLTFKIKNRPSK